MYEVDARPLDKVSIKREDEVRQRVGLALGSQHPYSFHAPVGAVRWELEVHIDIPNWPDFVARWPVEVGPVARSVEQAPAPEPATSAGDAPGPEIAPSATPEPESIDEPTGPGQGRSEETSTLATAIASIRSALNPTERDLTVASLKGSVHEVAMIVDQLSWTSALDRDDRMQGGRTVVGHLLDAPDTSVAVRFPPERNEHMDRVLAGEELAARAVMKDWNPLFARPEFDVLPAPDETAQGG